MSAPTPRLLENNADPSRALRIAECGLRTRCSDFSEIRNLQSEILARCITMMDVAAIVPAAGLGRRFKGTVNKLFASLGGEPLLACTLRVLQESSRIRWIVLVVHPKLRNQARAFAKRYQITKALLPCSGGSSRAESVMRGFAAIPREAKWVLVHDGARPCVSGRLITESVRMARRYGAVACGLPAGVTVKYVDRRSSVSLTLNREQLWFAQTPQVFRRDWFAQALAQADHNLEQFPDDAAILESAGFPVKMILGEPLNLKVTTQDDLLLAEAILKRRTSG